MAKNSTPTFVLTLELKENIAMQTVQTEELEIFRVMYNTVLGIYLKLEKQMKREKKYKKLIRQLKAINRKLEKETSDKFLTKEKKIIQKKLENLRKKYQLNEYASHEWVKPINKHFHNKVNSAFAQKMGTRAWTTFEKKMFGKAKKVKFVKKGEMESFEGKANNTGWRYVGRQIVYKNMETPLIFKKNDRYALEILKMLEEKTSFSYKVKIDGEEVVKNDVYRVKYVRMLKKEIRRKERYFAELVISGYPPSKNRKLGKGKVGIDIGTSSIAVASLVKVSMHNLAEQVKELSKEIRFIQRKMDRSKRATNPEYFNEDGTIKKGKKIWKYSNHYLKLKSKLKDLHRKQAVIRELSHKTLVNQLIELGDTFYTETMNFKALQKRKKETEISEKTGKYKRKKRFGKTLGNRAPGKFLAILDDKIHRLGGKLEKVNTHKFKASQYCHIRDDYFKKPLSQRWHVINDEIKIQRDLYSAFLLMNSNANGTSANRKLCDQTFNVFKELHDIEIDNILKEKKMILNSGIIVKI